MSSNKENTRMSRASLPVNFQRPQDLDAGPSKTARRSHAPRKSILKYNNASEDNTQELDGEDNTRSLDMRKSLARRVSFAAHAQVRLYNKESNPDGSSSSPSTSKNPGTSTPTPAPRRSSIRSRRSSTTNNRPGNDMGDQDGWEEGDSSMDIEDDEVNAQLYVAEGQAGDSSQEHDISQSTQDGDEDDDDMDMTTAFSNDIVLTNARRRSSAVPAAPAEPEPDAEGDNSIQASPAQTEASEAMEFTVALEQAVFPSKRASLANDAWAKLQQLQTQTQETNQESPSNDMDVQDAMKRIMAASTPKPQPALTIEDEGDSMDMSMDEGAGGPRAGPRPSVYREDQTMDFTSLVQGRLSIHQEREEELAGLVPPLQDNPFLMSSTAPSRESSAAPPSNFSIAPLAFSMSGSTAGPSTSTQKPNPPTATPAIEPPTTTAAVSTAASVPSDTPAWLTKATLPVFSRNGPGLSQSTAEPSTSTAPSISTLFSSTSAVANRSRIPSPVRRPPSPAKAPAEQMPPSPPRAQPIVQVVSPTPVRPVAAVTTARPTTPSRQTSSRATTPNRASPSKALTPSRQPPVRPTTPSKVGTPTRGTPGRGRPSVGTTPNSRKRPASPDRTTSPAKKLAVGDDARSQRSVSVEPVYVQTLAPPEPERRETSAPPEMQQSDSGRRLSSSFAQRRAKKNSLAGFGGLSTIAEVRESLGMSLGPAANGGLLVEEEEENESPISTQEERVVEEEPAAAVWDEYQQPLAGSSAVSAEPQPNRSFGDRPKISVPEFLGMVGIHFHDNMPVQRRHTLGPDLMTQSDGSLGPIPEQGHEFSLADYYRAEAVDLAQMDIYLWAISEIKTLMTQHKEELALLEEEIEENPPAAILDFLDADDEVRPQIEMMFKLAKSYAKRVSRGNWYRWRTQWTKDLQPHVETEIQNLEYHVAFVKEQRENLKDPMEDLRRMHASLKAELEKERKTVAEIEACDPDQLEGLKIGIAEQNTAIEGYKADIAQATAELDRCKAQLKERQTEFQAAQDVVAASKRKGEIMGTTKEDVVRRKAWFDTLQDFHGWRVTKVNPSLLEMQHLSLHSQVRVPMQSFKPTLQSFMITALPELQADERFKAFPVLSRLLENSATIVRDGNFGSHRSVVRYLDTTWASYSLVLVELRRLQIKHPLKVHLLDDGTLKAVATMVLRPKDRPDAAAKLLVTFTFTPAVLAKWPKELSSLGLEVHVAYGPIVPEEAKALLRERLSSSTADQHYCTLFDACGEIAARWGV